MLTYLEGKTAHLCRGLIDQYSKIKNKKKYFVESDLNGNEIEMGTHPETIIFTPCSKLSHPK